MTNSPILLNPALESKKEWIATLDSGVQVIGHFSDQLLSDDGRIDYLNTHGPTQLAFERKVIEGQGHSQHPHGFGSPLGPIERIGERLAQLNAVELAEFDVVPGQAIKLKFMSGITVGGMLKSVTGRNQNNLILSFEDCTVADAKGKLLFKPEWGSYDMIVGNQITQLIEHIAAKPRKKSNP